MVITDTPGPVFEKIALDIVGPLPKTKNNKEYILTIQDQLSKFSLAIPLRNTLATSIADAFIKRFICIFRTPKVLKVVPDSKMSTWSPHGAGATCVLIRTS